MNQFMRKTTHRIVTDYRQIIEQKALNEKTIRLLLRTPNKNKPEYIDLPKHSSKNKSCTSNLNKTYQLHTDNQGTIIGVYSYENVGDLDESSK